jgi:hypothetical protein
MENSEFPFRRSDAKRCSKHLATRDFAQLYGRIDVQPSFGLDVRTKNGESPETRASIGFHGFRRFRNQKISCVRDA